MKKKSIALVALIPLLLTSCAKAPLEEPLGEKNTQLKYIDGGQFHSLALDENSHLWSWGLNIRGQLGNGGTSEIKTPQLINEDIQFVKVAGGSYFSSGLDKNGYLYCWGQGGYGQLGNGTTENKYTPTKIEGLTFKDFACGGNHMVAISTDDVVYTWGANENMQLGQGNGNTTNLSSPTVVPGFPSDFVPLKVEAGLQYTMVLSTSGLIYNFGYNNFYQLGYSLGGGGWGRRVLNSGVPLCLQTMNRDVKDVRFVDIAGGSSHCLALTQEGKIYSWGWGESGQLGNNTSVVQGTQIIPLEGTYTKIFAGSFSSGALTADNEYYGWGLGSILGNDNYSQEMGSAVNLLVPTRIEKYVFSSISILDKAVIALTSDGYACAFGNNENNELGTGDTNQYEMFARYI